MKKFVQSFFRGHTVQFISLNILHILNDGYFASYMLLLPFMAKDLQLNLTQVGFLGTLYGSMNIALALPAGYIALRMGAMRTLFLGLGVYALGYFFTGFATEYWMLFITFLSVGIGIGVFHPVAFAFIAKNATKETRGKQMGNFTAIGDVGKIGLSTIITFIVVYLGWRYTAVIYATIALFAGFILFNLLSSKTEKTELSHKEKSAIRLQEIVLQKKFLFTTSAAFLDSFASTSLFIFLPFLLLHRGVSPALLGSFTAAFFIGNFLGKTSLGRFVDKFGNARVFIAAEVLMACFIFLLANATAIFIIIICSIILGVFTKGTTPVVQTMVSEVAEQHGHFEKTFAANAFLTSTAVTIAPVFLGFISDKFGITAAFNVMALTALLAAFPAIAFHRHKRIANVLTEPLD